MGSTFRFDWDQAFQPWEGVTVSGQGSRLRRWLGWWLTHAVALVITASLVGGIRLSGFWAALLASAVLGLANVWVRPILLLFTLPLNLATLGLFTLVVNGLVLWMTSWFVAGFTVTGVWAGIWGALVLSLVSWGLRWLLAQR
ncbi:MULTISPECIES: phage holin family protein [Limnochorda]|uniref:phage holin family protein n=1 Tax=Limnochorda TaxID=1676651 RepID=UPI0026F11CAA|nr:phage holin family protein [Limnochorda pilosa]